MRWAQARSCCPFEAGSRLGRRREHCRSGSRGSSSPRGAITRKDRATFLEGLAAGWSVAHAAKLAGHARQRFYDLRAADPDFSKAWREAWEAGADLVEDELYRAAQEGWQETDEEYDREGNLTRRTMRHRRDPRLLVRLERKRQPEASAPLVEVTVNPVRAKPVGPGDLVRTMREAGNLHLLPSMQPLLVRMVLPHLTPAELETLGLEIVDGEALELPRAEAPEESRNPASSQKPPEPLTDAQRTEVLVGGTGDSRSPACLEP